MEQNLLKYSESDAEFGNDSEASGNANGHPTSPVSKVGATVGTVVALIGIGALTGAVATLLILGVNAFLGQLGNPTSVEITQLIFSILRRMMNVFVVWVQAPLDGAFMGAITGLAVSIAYLFWLWIERSLGYLRLNGWLMFIVFAVAGALGAALGSQGVLTDVRYWAMLGGTVYGIGTAYTISKSRSE